MDLPLEIIVVTDREVWNTGELFKHVQRVTTKGDIWLLGLSTGKDLSHAFVEGMA
jgi:hypothetical protein